MIDRIKWVLVLIIVGGLLYGVYELAYWRGVRSLEPENAKMRQEILGYKEQVRAKNQDIKSLEDSSSTAAANLKRSNATLATELKRIKDEYLNKQGKLPAPGAPVVESVMCEEFDPDFTKAVNQISESVNGRIKK